MLTRAEEMGAIGGKDNPFKTATDSRFTAAFLERGKTAIG